MSAKRKDAVPEQEGPNPLFAVGKPKEKPMSKDEARAAFAPDPEETEQEEMSRVAIQEAEPVVAQVTPPSPAPEPAPEQPKFSLPPGPPVKRKKVKGLKFTDRYETRSLSIDKRLLSAFDDFMEAGDTKTQVANQVVLKILLEAGYDIDPTILSKPFNKPGK
jgi:hypothetical protein